MSEKEKILDIFEGINKSNTIEVLRKLKEFRKTGKVNQLPQIIAFLSTTDNEELKKNIVQILNDIKLKSATEIIVKEIENKKDASIQHELVSSCWQSGLDYSKYFNFFVELMLKCNYLTAIETFTVLEEMELKAYSDEEIETFLKKLKAKVKSFEQDKQFLVRELIQIIEGKKAG